MGRSSREPLGPRSDVIERLSSVAVGYIYEWLSALAIADVSSLGPTSSSSSTRGCSPEDIASKMIHVTLTRHSPSQIDVALCSGCCRRSLLPELTLSAGLQPYKRHHRSASVNDLGCCSHCWRATTLRSPERPLSENAKRTPPPTRPSNPWNWAPRSGTCLSRLLRPWMLE